MKYLNEFDATMKLIQGKWKIMIIYALHENGMMRFHEIQKHIIEVSHKTLTNQLRAMEADELIGRHVVETSPIQVSYHLTKKGDSLIPLLDEICAWGLTNTPENKIERVLCSEE